MGWRGRREKATEAFYKGHDRIDLVLKVEPALFQLALSQLYGVWCSWEYVSLCWFTRTHVCAHVFVCVCVHKFVSCLSVECMTEYILKQGKKMQCFRKLFP